MFIKLLNKIRVDAVDVSTDDSLKSKLVQQSEEQYRYHAFDYYNECMFSDHSLRLISLPAKDHIRKNCNTSDVLQAQYRKQSD